MFRFRQDEGAGEGFCSLLLVNRRSWGRLLWQPWASLFICEVSCLERFGRRCGVPMLGKGAEIWRILAQYLLLTLKNKFKSKYKYICKRKVILE